MTAVKRPVLLVDGVGVITTIAKRVFASAAVDLVVVGDVQKAKARLVESPPQLIISSFTFGGDREAGPKFCNDLRGHPILSSIPIMLLDTKLQKEDIERAKVSGAKAIISLPVDDEAILKALKGLLPGVWGGAPVAAGAASGDTATFEEKLAYAQQLLSKVVHNLKTSHLLQVVEKEDVPRVVCEITKNVCGIKSEQPASKTLSSKDVEVDLSSVFGLKKG